MPPQAAHGPAGRANGGGGDGGAYFIRGRIYVPVRLSKTYSRDHWAPLVKEVEIWGSRSYATRAEADRALRTFLKTPHCFGGVVHARTGSQRAEFRAASQTALNDMKLDVLAEIGEIRRRADDFTYARRWELPWLFLRWFRRPRTHTRHL
ncbi:hypothetical protein HUT18_15435 [Streptomyces sp. NA04227]|uniref:hypothetical protein n=1 Tax=Streptomyces sp. NA04227 TaxID=2742136 RepID=UPI0015902A81|nr:hypothetical protein [Streptomyces sp. NA04227]QKW07563.1 hypothetical protein HUT18_15435 [Streptomyces sp. NA04227]